MAKKLLLADDSITIQKVVGITLANEDLEITSVDNGEDAVARAKAIRPDLVLADASMPKRDGYQVAEALKGDPATAGIPVLILAGQLEGHPDQARLTACRADGYIPKPFESQLLIDRVRKALGLAGPVARPVATPAPAATAATARPAPGAPLTAPRPAAPPAPTPVPAPMPVAAAPAPVTAPTTPAPVAARAPVIDETDFGELSAAPAASGDQDLWGNDAPLAASAPDENLWSSGGEKTPPPPTGTPMTATPMTATPPSDFMHPDDAPQFVTNAAELANIEKYDGDASPSGLDLDDAVPRGPSVRPGDDNLEGNIPIVPPGIQMTHEPTGEVPIPPGAGGVNIPPEKLEAIVREVVQKMIGPILEKIAWEVVPDLAEDIIRDELKRLTGGAVQGSKTGTA